MYQLDNGMLKVTVLDPVADRARLGTRYCTGGYIFEVVDPRYGNVMSGPTYPDSFNTFDGQGIPDAFNLGPLYPFTGPVARRGPQRHREALDTQALILGIGICDLAADTVTTWCQWDVSQAETQLEFKTHHSFRGYEIDLERRVSLMGRTVRSATRVVNHGIPCAVRWFPHPFYPQPPAGQDALCKLNLDVHIAENPGYTLGPDGFIQRKNPPTRAGYYLPLDHEAHSNLVVLQRHPQLGLVAATTSYVPDFFPIWGNDRTFSWEPFLERTLAPRQDLSWWIDYDF